MYSEISSDVKPLGHGASSLIVGKTRKNKTKASITKAFQFISLEVKL
jgi:hypothetical protein